VSHLKLVPQKKTRSPKSPAAAKPKRIVIGLPRPAVRTLAVVSGKGGVGKSNVVANLAVAMGEMGASVLVLDADLGQANQDVLLGVHPRVDLLSVLRGECSLEDILIEGPAGVKLVPAGSGDPLLADVDDVRRERLFREIGALAAESDIVLIDNASGASRQAAGFALAAREVVVVTTPEPTAYADSYGLIKVLARQGLANQWLGLGQLAFLAHHQGQVVERNRHVGVFIAQEFAVERQHVAVHRLGFGEFAFVLENQGELVEQYGHLQVVLTELFPCHV